SSRRRHTRCYRDWSSDVCSSDLDAACPSQAPACRAKAYLVPGDLVLTGAARGPFTCVAYQSPRDRKQNWTNGWFPSARLQAVAPARAPRVKDWTGTWTHAGGEIELRAGEGGKLATEGLHELFV